MAGNSTYKTSEVHSFPKMLSEINGKLLIERSASPFLELSDENNIIAVLPKKQMVDFNLDKVLKLISSSISICSISDKTQGAACSALLAIEHLDLDTPLIISSFDQILDLDLSPLVNQFIEQDVDAGVLTFEAVHPKWSFVKVNEHSYVTQAAEKSPISKTAIAGFYYFKKASVFVESTKHMIRNNVMHENLFYISHTLNEVILRGGKVLSLPIPKDKYFHFHDDHALDLYEEHFNLTHSSTNPTILTRTEAYVKAFDSKSISAVADFFSPNFTLTDPATSISGKDKVIDYIQSIFESTESIRFVSKKIMVDSNNSVIEFELILDGKVLLGTDIIKWDNENKMISMNAYLYECNNG